MSKLDVFHSQIVASYLNKRQTIYDFIKTCKKNKDALLRLKINNIPIIVGDEIRFPNIETQKIFDNERDNLLVYPNRKIKYIRQEDKHRDNWNYKNVSEFNLKSDEYKNIMYLKIDYNHNKTIHIYNQFDTLISLRLEGIYRKRDKLKDISINLPLLKSLILVYYNNVNFTLNTPSLKFLDAKYFKSIKISFHDLIAVHTYEIKKIECNFHYPFYYNGEKCNNINEYLESAKFKHKLQFDSVKEYYDSGEYFKLDDESKNRIDFINMEWNIHHLTK